MKGSDNNTQAISADDEQAVARLGDARDKVTAEISKAIVGMEPVIDEMMITIIARGHALLVGVPGLAKTLLVSSLAQTLSLDFKRIQFTPDLMPSDITGTELLQDDPVTKQRVFKFTRGPIFAHLILADEINRTPPKTQAALLEAMQERKISAGGEDFELEEPFFVLATQNPIEQEGTYPLPEAQLDRFLFNILVDYPSWDEEIDIVERIRNAHRPSHPAQRGRRTRLHPGMVVMGSGTPRELVHGGGRQGARGTARPVLCLTGRYSGRRQAGTAPSHHSQFRRPVRRPHAGRYRRQTSRID